MLGTQTEPEEAEPEPTAGATCWESGERERLLLPWQEALGREPGSFWNSGASRGQAVGWFAGKMSGSCGEGLPVKAGGRGGAGAKKEGSGLQGCRVRKALAPRRAAMPLV